MDLHWNRKRPDS